MKKTGLIPPWSTSRRREEASSSFAGTFTEKQIGMGFIADQCSSSSFPIWCSQSTCFGWINWVDNKYPVNSFISQLNRKTMNKCIHKRTTTNYIRRIQLPIYSPSRNLYFFSSSVCASASIFLCSDMDIGHIQPVRTLRLCWYILCVWCAVRLTKTKIKFEIKISFAEVNWETTPTQRRPATNSEFSKPLHSPRLYLDWIVWIISGKCRISLFFARHHISLSQNCSIFRNKWKKWFDLFELRPPSWTIHCHIHTHRSPWYVWIAISCNIIHDNEWMRVWERTREKESVKWNTTRRKKPVNLINMLVSKWKSAQWNCHKICIFIIKRRGNW